MDAREWWTVIFTALAGPFGSIGLGIGLARWADATTGGMAALAGGVVGLWLGAPLAALMVFAICLFTVARPLPLRRWIALLVMLAAVIVEAIVVLRLRGRGAGFRHGTGFVTRGATVRPPLPGTVPLPPGRGRVVGCPG